MGSFPFHFSIVRVVLCLATVVLWFGAIGKAGTPPSKMQCFPCSVAFGKVKLGSSKSVVVVLRNSGGTAVTIYSESKDAAWVSPQGLPLPYRLAAGKDVRFNLVYGPRDGRAVNGHITFHSNAVNQNLVIGVTGSAATAGLLIANPSAQTFGSVQVGATATLHQTLTNTSNPIFALRAESAPHSSHRLQ